MKNYMRKLRKNVKALSPIFAVLILIAIAVIGGIIIYMFTSGYLGTMMGGGTTGQEKVAIQSVQVTGTGFTVWAKSTGGGDVTVTDVILKDSAGNQVGAPFTVSVILLGDGTMGQIDVTTTLTAGEVYTATLSSSEGNQFVSPSFKG